MSPIQSWWNWCTESFGHMFAGVTAPILLISAVVVLFVMGNSGGGDLNGPQPPRSDVAGVCVNATPLAGGVTVCSTSTASGSTATVATATPVPPTPTPAPRTYTVKAGDTLSVICAREAPDMTLDACVNAIVNLSDLGGPDEITEGQSLKLPPKAAGSSGSGNTAAAAGTPEPVATPVVSEPETAAEDEPEVTEEATEEPEPTPYASLVALGPAETADEEAAADEEETAEPEATEDEPGDETLTDEELAASAGSEYEVQDGDSLLGICVNEVPDMPEADCMEFVVTLNGLSGPDEITAGKVLILP